jgi:uncharacterized protein YbaP (TraB family)
MQFTRNHTILAQALGLATVLLSVLAFGNQAFAQCAGENLINAMPTSQAAALREQAAQYPYATGNFWRATKGTQQVTLIGTYHAKDPRHKAVMATITPAIDAATQVLVEAGPNEEAALKAKLAAEPGLLITTDGPTLRETLPLADWEKLAKAATARGIPPFMVSKFRPWYVSVLLSMPACLKLDATAVQGLDWQIMQHAAAVGVPVQGLEPFDTVFKVFGALPDAEQRAMITSALAIEDQSANMSVTLADAYFAQESRLIWALSKQTALKLPGYTPERMEREFALIEDNLINTRNRSWISVIEEAARKGPVFVAFGALHLSGENGVLALLEAQGFNVVRLPL